MSKNKEIKTKGKASSEDAMIGANLNKIRKLNNVSQTELASFLGMTFQQVQKYEKGINRISASRLFELANALRVPVSYFFDGRKVPDREPNMAPCRKTTQWRPILILFQAAKVCSSIRPICK